MAYKLASEVAEIIETGQFAGGGYVNILLRKQFLCSNDPSPNDPSGYRHAFDLGEDIREMAWRVIEGSSYIAKANLLRIVSFNKFRNSLDHGGLPLAVTSPGWARVESVDVALRDHSAGSVTLAMSAAMSATVFIS